jgi:hypothetical protein
MSHLTIDNGKGKTLKNSALQDRRSRSQHHGTLNMHELRIMISLLCIIMIRHPYAIQTVLLITDALIYTVNSEPRADEPEFALETGKEKNQLLIQYGCVSSHSATM